MGSRGAFLPQGVVSEPLKYQEIGKIEGVKVLRDPTAQKQSLPQRANTSSAYVGVDSRGNVKQLRVFEKRLPSIDIDFGHSHHHGLSKDDFHVHEYPNGERSNVSRTLTSAEWLRWRPVIAEILRRRR
ncbi:MAG: hypothetical protein IJ387_07585 [Thermoguttaceae bacterium]|nr:hypothetical protein [Thermoguttaceae bacterium]